MIDIVEKGNDIVEKGNDIVEKGNDIRIMSSFTSLII